MMKNTKSIFILAMSLLVATNSASAMQSIDEDTLRDLTGQSGVDIDINFKGTVGRIYFSTKGKDISNNDVTNTLNFRNFSIDTDGTNHGANSDRAIKVKLDLVEKGLKSGLAAVITNINDLDLKFEQFNVNGDSGSGAIAGEAGSPMHSYGGLSLLNINDHNGETNVNFFARGKSGKEGMQMEIQLPKLLTLNLKYTDYGSDNTNNNTTKDDDFSFSGDLALNNFTVENSIDLITGKNAKGEDVGGLHIGVITQTGDITLSNMKAGSQAGTMGRMVINGYRMTPESYLTIQGK